MKILLSVLALSAAVLLAPLARAAVDDSIKALGAETKKERASAIVALVAAKKDAVAPCLEALKSTNDVVRAHAADALGQIKDPSAVAPLIERLNTDAIAAVRWKAAEALGRLEDKSALDALREHLKDAVEDNDNVQLFCGVAVSRLCQKKEIPFLIELLDREEQTIRDMAIGRLYYLTLETLGYNSKDKLANRKGGVEKWKTWWEENKDKLDQVGEEEKWEKEAETMKDADAKPATETAPPSETTPPAPVENKPAE